MHREAFNAAVSLNSSISNRSPLPSLFRQLESSLRQAGVLLESIGNRDANYAEILAAMGEDCPS